MHETNNIGVLDFDTWPYPKGIIFIPKDGKLPWRTKTNSKKNMVILVVWIDSKVKIGEGNEWKEKRDSKEYKIYTFCDTTLLTCK